MTPGPKPRHRAAFFRELAQLTGAGISVTQAGKVMGQEWREASVREAVVLMDRGLAEGRTIADALSGSLTPMEHGILGAAERGGRLAEGFRHLEGYYHLLDQTAARVRGALLYPLFMLHASVLLPTLLSGVLAGGSPGQIVKSLGLALAGIWGALALLWVGGRGLGRRAVTSAAVDRVLGMLPWAGSARRTLALARWHAVMHFNIASSQRISEGLKEAGRATGGALLNAASQSAARAVENGAELGRALIAQPAFPRRDASALAAAEFTGNLDTETLRLSRESMTEAAATLETNTKRLCGVFYGLVVAFTAWQILRVAGLYMGMYSKFIDEL